ncbi:NAD-dependent epimerase/dehydratase family protein [Polaromonas hydrogenivorans]|uniref:NAD-dependent epimerase/dehydratase family protein n=1 Tax=Polaromonas hydrogenivorans TaxID=335476 RepID=A0AAU7M1G1_9BURK
MLTYFLTGSTGYIGGAIADELVKRGHQVRGLVRSQEKAAQLSERGITPVLGDLDASELLTNEAKNSDGVINTANADHARAINALITGLAGSGKPLIHTSGSSVVGDDARGAYCSSAIFDENTPMIVNPRKQARRDIDLMVLGAAQQNIRSVVICPSNIYGLGSGLNPNSLQVPFLAENARNNGVVQIVGQGLNTWSNVHIDDLVDLYIRALANAPAGAFYFAENGEESFRNIGQALAKRLGLSDVEALDPELAAQRWGETRAYFTYGSNSRVRAARARQELGWKPRHSSVTDWILNELPI